jgi:predicted metal-dependent phosphoesterase TrpH
MKIDLHVHTLERSPCARASEDEQIQAAIAAGLDAMFITDHWTLVPAERLAALNQRYQPFRIYGGIELTVEGDDLLVLGIQDPILEIAHWHYTDLHDFVRQQDGFLILAHPFRYQPRITLPLDDYPPDAIEVYSPNTPATAEAEIRAFARRLSVPLLSNSDAHTAERLGSHYNLLANGAHDLPTIFSTLRTGEYSLYRKNQH